MASHLPHIEETELTHYIRPIGEFQQFLDNAHYAEKVREWGLSGTKEVKKEFWYKGHAYQRLVTIKGYGSYGITGEYNTLVIEFQDGNLSCIHPALLKEMQAASYGKESLSQDRKTPPIADHAYKTTSSEISEPPLPKKAAQTKARSQVTPKLVLPEEKTHFSGKVKQFALSWNHFKEENDEVIVLENIRIEQDDPIEVGFAWCSHSKTLKKLELTLGEMLEFDGKILKKSLPKGKDVQDEALLIQMSVQYKINNPSKIKKM